MSLIGYIRRIVFTVLWLVVAVFLLLALISYTPNDPSWSHVSSVSSDMLKVSNLAGWQGAWVSDVLYTLLGLSAWWGVIIAVVELWRVWQTHLGYHPNAILRMIGYGFLIIGSAAIAALVLPSLSQGANFLGLMVGLGLSGLMGKILALLFLSLFTLITAAFVFDIFWLNTRDRWLANADQNMPTHDMMDTTKQPSLAQENTSQDNTSQDNTSQEATETTQIKVLGNGTATESPIIQDPQTGYLSSFLQKIRPAAPVEPVSQTAGQNPASVTLPAGETTLANEATLATTALIDTKRLDAQLYKEALAEKKVPNAPDEQVETLDTQTLELDSPNTLPPEPLVNKPMALKSDFLDQGMADPTNLATVATLADQEISLPEIPLTETATATSPIYPVPIEDESNVARAAILPAVAVTLPNQTAIQTEIVAPLLSVSPNAPIAPIESDEEVRHDPDIISSSPVVHPSDIVYRPTPLSEATADIGENFVHKDALDSLDDNELHGFVKHNPSDTDDSDGDVNDLHNDSLFQSKSRAMQTAAYRASLTPVPDLSILDLPEADRKPSYTPEQLRQMAELLEIKLQEFNVKSTVVNAEPGPVVTRFEVDLAAGIKASKVTGISRDLARSLSLASVRVVEVIPGKPYIGIEVPNPTREMVRLIELLDTADYKNPNSHISMAMGKDIAGRPVITDLARAPHMLVAGTTGSGKSVLVNSMLLSILLKYTPDQLRMILIDPKQLELANYGDIPHLLTPVVTDMTEAASALSWCVAEMERRYQLMSIFKVRKLDEFNKKVLAAEEQGHPLLDPLWRPNDSVSVTTAPKIKTLPLIVIVADEFADMIMQVGKQAEELITRLAQKSRAAGIHLILATQRPSVDVITGLIKANIPARAALRVNSKIDSRTILDAGGAEDMLGHGDMLFLGPGQIEPNRVHGAFVSDGEVNRVCDAWRERGAPDYIENMFDNFEVGAASSGSGSGEGGPATGDQDVFYDEAVAFVLETRKVSASSIQRKFSIGYNRAARLVDAMEEAGLVSPLGKNGKREILM